MNENLAHDNQTEKESRFVHSVVEAARFMGEMLYQGIYIINYQENRFLYVSDNPLLLCGCTVDEVQQQGFDFFKAHVPTDEWEKLIEIKEAGQDFFSCHIPWEEKLHCTMSYTFHLLCKENPLLVHHQLTPLEITTSGQIKIALCMVSLSSKGSFGHVEFYLEKSDSHWEYLWKTKQWRQKQKITLTSVEKQVLLLSSQGLTVEEIAHKLFRSENTIKFHRRNIFHKTETSTITEALMEAMEDKLW